MGNRLCKRKTGEFENENRKQQQQQHTNTTPTPLDKIINRLNLKPNSWKSDSNPSQKDGIKSNKLKINRKPADARTSVKDKAPKTTKIQATEWVEAKLEVPNKTTAPMKAIEHIDVSSPLSFKFNDPSLNIRSEEKTPIPPPRRHKKKKIHEKLKNALNTKTVTKTQQSAIKESTLEPVNEPLCIKKYVVPTAPKDETHDCGVHRHPKKILSTEKPLKKISSKEEKRFKNLSVISLPNYTDFKLTVAKLDKNVDGSGGGKTDSSQTSLSDQLSQKRAKLMTRCRSFGSLLPLLIDNNSSRNKRKLSVNHQKVNTRKSAPIPATAGEQSDDSFGVLEDWDLRLIEHYNPKDASLPRQSRRVVDVAELESLIVPPDDVEAKKNTAAEVTASKSNVIAPDQSSLLRILEKHYDDKVDENKEHTPDIHSGTTSLVSEVNNDKQLLNNLETFIENEKCFAENDIHQAKIGHIEKNV